MKFWSTCTFNISTPWTEENDYLPLWQCMVKRSEIWCPSLLWILQCLQDIKPSNYAPYGLLNSLEVPMRPWKTIGIDFVGPLPESKTLNGSFDMIMVVICHLTSLVHLIPTKQTYHAKDIAEVIFDRVYKHHRMPKNIVSDCDTLFTSTFWWQLHELTNTELWMSLAYHPQSDGTTEWANCTMTQMERQCMSPG